MIQTAVGGIPVVTDEHTARLVVDTQRSPVNAVDVAQIAVTGNHNVTFTDLHQ